jgi:hypothetical protein
MEKGTLGESCLFPFERMEKTRQNYLRQRSDPLFPPRVLEEFIWGSDFCAKRRDIAKLIESDPILCDEIPHYELSRRELRER